VFVAGDKRARPLCDPPGAPSRASAGWRMGARPSRAAAHPASSSVQQHLAQEERIAARRLIGERRHPNPPACRGSGGHQIDPLFDARGVEAPPPPSCSYAVPAAACRGAFGELGDAVPNSSQRSR
jgi:hypothetical protein